MTYLIDASIYIFRAWFSIPDSMMDESRNPVNAVYGYARFLSEFLETVQPDFVAVAFDASRRTSFRNQIYPGYKANREPTPPELKRQFEQCRDVTRALGIMHCSDEAFEADDLIGTLAAGMREEDHSITILSRDKDLVQILREGDTFWDYAGNKKIRYDQVSDSYGVRAEQMVDFLALSGDSVDCIPGAPGVGPKTAGALLEYFVSIDELYDNLDKVADIPVRGAGKLAARLVEHQDKVRMSRELAQIRYDVPVETSERALARQVPDLPALNSIYDEAGFGDGLRRQAQRILNSY